MFSKYSQYKNKKLQQENEKLQQENEKLQQENEKLQKEIEFLKQENHNLNQQLYFQFSERDLVDSVNRIHFAMIKKTHYLGHDVYILSQFLQIPTNNVYRALTEINNKGLLRYSNKWTLAQYRYNLLHYLQLN